MERKLTHPKKRLMARRAYDYFVRAERSGRIITAVQIEQASGYTSRVVRTYLVRKWQWFLTAKENEHFAVAGLVGYPRAYFINAHLPGRAKYFTHFAPYVRILQPREQSIIDVEEDEIEEENEKREDTEGNENRVAVDERDLHRSRRFLLGILVFALSWKWLLRTYRIRIGRFSLPLVW